MKQYSEFVKVITKLGMKYIGQLGANYGYTGDAGQFTVQGIRVTVGYQHHCRPCRSFIKRWTGDKPVNGKGIVEIEVKLSHGQNNTLSLCHSNFRFAKASDVAKDMIHTKDRSKKVVEAAGETFVSASLSLEDDDVDAERWDLDA